MLYETLPAFNEYVHPESRLFLTKKDCACCGTDMKGRPFAMVGVSESYKFSPDHERMYFPIYQLVCETCFEFIFNENFEKPSYKNQPKQPRWSRISNLTLTHRPSGLAILSDEDALIDLFLTLYQSTDSWEDFSDYSCCETMSDFLGFV
jgi:hypothetical protein